MTDSFLNEPEPEPQRPAAPTPAPPPETAHRTAMGHLMASFAGGAPLDADTDHLAASLGWPAAAVLADPQSAAISLAMHQAGTALARAPGIAGWLAKDLANAEVARTDVEPLSRFETHLRQAFPDPEKALLARIGALDAAAQAVRETRVAGAAPARLGALGADLAPDGVVYAPADMLRELARRLPEREASGVAALIGRKPPQIAVPVGDYLSLLAPHDAHDQLLGQLRLTPDGPCADDIAARTRMAAGQGQARSPGAPYPTVPQPSPEDVQRLGPLVEPRPDKPWYETSKPEVYTDMRKAMTDQQPTEAAAGLRPEVEAKQLADYRALMVDAEGYREDAYFDTENVLTIGIGHKVLPGDHLKFGDKISPAKVEALYKADSQAALDAARAQAKEAGITDPDFIPFLASMNFQLGVDWRKKFPKTWQMIVDGDYEGAAKAFGTSLWQKQTPNRVITIQKALRALPPKPGGGGGSAGPP